MTKVLAGIGVATLLSGVVVMGTSGSAQAAGSEPEGNQVRVTICHKNQGATGYVVQSPEASSILSQGHTEHQDGQDIIPPFAWWEKVGDGPDSAWVRHDEAGQNTDKLSWIGNGCKPPKPSDVRETRDLPGVLDCGADTFTVDHQERTLTHDWDGEEWVAVWSEWSTFESTVTTPTIQQCPTDGEDPCPNGDHNGAGPGCGTSPPPPPSTDRCKNIPGDQVEVPAGHSESKGVCTKGAVLPTETEKPKPTKTPEPEVAPSEKPKPTEAADPSLAPAQVAGTATALPHKVAGTAEAVPTAVAAGLGGPSGTDRPTGSVLGQGLVGAGMLMLLLAGALRQGRRERGAHQV